MPTSQPCRLCSFVQAYNKRIQNINRVPDGFPTFVRDGYEVKVRIPALIPLDQRPVHSEVSR